MTDKITHLYRAEDDVDHLGQTKVYIHKIEVVKATPRGFWIALYRQRKWVSAHSRKRHAYPTVFEAVKALRERRKAQRRILEAQLKRVKLTQEFMQTFGPKHYPVLDMPNWEPLSIPGVGA